MNEVALTVIEGEYWNRRFEEEKNLLMKILSGNYVAIEHVGSTAIPGIVAKPIIDIAIGIKSLDDAERIKILLEKAGYEHRANHGDEYRLLFIRSIDGRRICHIHLEEINGRGWNNHIKFRDYLLRSSRLRQEYMDLKLELAKKYPMDRARYTSEKADFIQAVLKSEKDNICEC